MSHIIANELDVADSPPKHMTCDLERPCNRCIKRSIGHLCHDEPRESYKSKSDAEIAVVSEGTIPPPLSQVLLGPPLDRSSAEQPLLGGIGTDMDMGLTTDTVNQDIQPSLPTMSDTPGQQAPVDDTNQPCRNMGRLSLK